MGCHLIIWVIFSLFVAINFRSSNGASENVAVGDPLSLDALIRDYAKETLKPDMPTGTFHNVSLPADLAGMEVSVIKLRSNSLWDKGLNFSSCSIPPKVKTFPFQKRLVIVIQNLGNLSNVYYNVPDHPFVAPVVGLMAYDATNISALGSEKLTFTVEGNSISVRFPRFESGKHSSSDGVKCVKFSESGLIQFMELKEDNVCMSQGGGHFSVVAVPKGRKLRSWVWWVIGIGAGTSLVLLGVIGFTSYKVLRNGSFRTMEEESENGVTLQTTRIGTSRMPSASTVRTQPILENEYVP